MLSSYVVIAGLTLIVLSLAVVVYMLLRGQRDTADKLKLEKLDASRKEPASLHPVIDPNICIGSLSCISACPEGDILGIVDGSAKLIVGANCIGHGRCSLECPVDAIKLVFGTETRGVDLPEVSEVFESSRQGVHIVGELSGMGLIKNAMTQGLQLADYLARTAKALIDEARPVVIVGAGPAGIATAVGLRAAGVPFRLLEQDTVGGTTARYPRQKIVMTSRVELPGYGKFGAAQISKESLVETWGKVIAKTGIKVEEGVKVEGVDGDPGAFTVKTTKGAITASRVVLAIGRRGSPRKIGVQGETAAKVTYSLIDPEQYRGQKVLVVGGGDSALEAALAIADEPGAEVSISYRQAEFGKCREANKQKIAAAFQSGKIKPYLPSTIDHINETEVVLKTGETTTTVKNDYVLACLGGELPTEFLKALQIGMTRHTGQTEIVQIGKKQASEKSRHLGWYLAAVGVAIVALLTLVGFSYYMLPVAQRLKSPLHEMMRPAGAWGHGIGIFATLFMLLNFLYPVRKRTRFLKGTAPIKSWLTFHVFVGTMSPAMIAFHTAFHSRNLLATATFVALLIVATTGLIGRYIYALAARDPKRKKLMSLWRALHVVLAVFLVLIIVVHVSVSLYLGYTWVF